MSRGSVLKCSNIESRVDIMKKYDVFISIRISADMPENSDIINIRRAAGRIAEIYRVIEDTYGSGKAYSDAGNEFRKAINSSLCSIVVVTSEDMNGFMAPIMHTLVKNKRLCVLVLDKGSHNVKLEIKADGYENLTVGVRTSNADYFELFNSFIASAKREEELLCGRGL